MNDYCQISFIGIKPHYSLAITTTLMKIDGWQSNNFLIFIDDIQKIALQFIQTDDLTERFCTTSTNNDAIRPISLNTSHNSATATIKLTSDLVISSALASWGFRDVVINIDKCHASCAQCTGPAITQCSSCYSNALLIITGIFKSCVCISNYYMFFYVPCTTSQCSLCTLCSNSCKTCYDSTSIQCLSCYSSTFLYNGQCLAQCPTGKYADLPTLTCLSCDISCQTCVNEFLTCTSCPIDSYLMNYNCLNSCPAGYYGQNNLKVCLQCNNACSKCSFSANNCTSCNTPYFLDSFGSCSLDCPNGKWKDFNVNQCMDCLSPCATCTAASFCLSCSSPYFYFERQCLLNCPTGYYKNEVFMICSQCSSNCKACEGFQSNCTDCYSNYVIDGEKCSDKCSPGRFLPLYSSICQDCDSNCLTCDSNSTRCTSCISSLFLQHKTCVKNCDYNEFIDEGNICNRCHVNCLSCLGNSANCLECTDNSLYVNSGNCQQSCPTDKYTYQLKKQCFLCASDCDSCFGETIYSCLTCSNNLYLYNNTCIKQCPDYTYVDFSNICQLCSSNCIICNTSNYCIECDIGYYIAKNGKCTQQQLISATLEMISNPFSFLINCSNANIDKNNITFDFNEILDYITILIYDNTSGRHYRFTSDAINDLNNIYLAIKYEEIVNANAFIQVSFKTYYNINYSINLTNSTINLHTFPILCNEGDSYYDDITKTCKKKTLVSFYLDYSDFTTKYLIVFNPPSLFEKNNWKDYFFVEISNYMNYTYTINEISSTISSKILQIEFIFLETLINGNFLTVNLLIPSKIVLVRNIIIQKNEDKIKMIDYYILAKKEKEMSDSANSFSSFADIFNFINVYINLFLNGNSSFLIQGVMLINLLFMLKFLEVNYPPNITSMFKSRKDINNLFGVPQISVNIADKQILPTNIGYYSVSEYFINNVASSLVQILLIILLEIGLLACWRFLKNKQLNSIVPLSKATLLLKRFIKILKKTFVWAMILNVLMSKYQYLLFYSFLTMKFPPLTNPKGVMNLFLAIINFLLIIFLPFHIFKLLSISLKLIPNSSPSLKSKKINALNKKKSILLSSHIYIPNRKNTLETYNNELQNSKITPLTISSKKIQDFWLREEAADYNSPMADSFKIIDFKNSEEEQPQISIINNNKIPSVNFEINPIDIAKFLNLDNDNLNQVKQNKEKEDLKEVNIGFTIQEKCNKGLMTDSEWKSLHFLFQGNIPKDISLPPIKIKLEPLKPLEPSLKASDPIKDPIKGSEPNKAIPIINALKPIKAQKAIKAPENLIKSNILEVRDMKKKSNSQNLNKISYLLKKFIKFCFKVICFPVRWFSFKYYDFSKHSEKRFNKRFSFLWCEFSSRTSFRRFHLLFDFLRHYLIVFVILALYGMAFTQIVLILIFNLSFFLYLVIIRPFKKAFKLVLALLNELLINVILVVVMKLVILDKENSNDSEKRLLYGWIIVYMNILLMYSMVFLTIIRIMSRIKYLLVIMCKKKNKLHPLEIKNADIMSENSKRMVINKDKNNIKDKRKDNLSIFNTWNKQK